MPQGGTLTISAHNDGDMVAIDISDTGSGITPEHLDKLFEPLFTTKPKGIGLGLAVCKNLIEANGGAIRVESKEHEGTTFTVTLPLKEEV
jgi:signal transduction histidine kinase